MARMGDWRENKDIEIPLDGIGGVNIVVKADVHRAGMLSIAPSNYTHTKHASNTFFQASISPATPSKTKPKPKASPKWPAARACRFSVCRITSFGISTRMRNRGMLRRNEEKKVKKGKGRIVWSGLLMSREKEGERVDWDRYSPFFFSLYFSYLPSLLFVTFH